MRKEQQKCELGHVGTNTKYTMALQIHVHVWLFFDGHIRAQNAALKVAKGCGLNPTSPRFKMIETTL